MKGVERVGQELKEEEGATKTKQASGRRGMSQLWEGRAMLDQVWSLSSQLSLL